MQLNRNTKKHHDGAGDGRALDLRLVTNGDENYSVGCEPYVTK